LDKTSSRFQIFVLLVLMFGLISLTAVSKDLESFEGRFNSPVNFMLWMAMLCIVALSPIPRSNGRSMLVMTPALDMAAILLFGTGIASWFGVFSRLLSNSAERWTPVSRSVLRLAQAAVAIGAAGWVYVRLGGNTGLGVFENGSQVVVVMAASIAYMVVNDGVGTLGAYLSAQPSARFVWFTEIKERVLADALTLPFGSLIAVTQLTVGPLGVALFLVPLLLARHVYKLWIEMKRAHLETVRMLMSATDATDPNTRGHSYRICKMSIRLGRYLEMPAGDLEQLEYAAILHDIGRTAIAHDLLTKTGKLTEEEHSVVRAHPRIGAEILSRLRFFEEAAEIVHSHHEQPDGQGYPRGLVGDQVPLGGRIIMVVAAFDAMTSDRPYRRGLSPDAAFEELLNHSGTQFATEVVEALIALYTTGELFDEFEEEELDRYADETCNSRALEQFVARRRNNAVPEKVFCDSSATGIPMIDMPDPGETQFVEREYVLDPDSEARLRVAAASDVGCARENNEDSFGVFRGDCDDRGVLLILADGMGGEAAGEVASAMAVDAVRSVYFEANHDSPPREALERAIELANQAIHSKASSDPALDGMGTTCTAAAIVGMDMTIGHIGDSRAYLIASGEITMLTRDHTLAAELADLAGTDLAGTGASNMLTRCLGSRPEVEVDESEEPISLEPDDVVVLCSDGLSNMVDVSEIQEIASGADPGAACRELVELARQRGGPDNITVTVARLAA
jgi:putative nucleotidyltransferase with HDIG domain